MGDFFVYAAFFGALLFVFPVFVYVDFYADIGRPKSWFSVSLTRCFRVFGGYAELRKDGIAVHLTKKFALVVKYEDLGATRKKFEIMKGFQLWRLHQTVELGGAQSPYSAIAGAVFASVGGAALSVLRTRHPFLSLRSKLLLSDRPTLKVTAETAVVFNLLVLFTALAKKGLEALIIWIRKHRSTASWRRRRSVSSVS